MTIPKRMMSSVALLALVLSPFASGTQWAHAEDPHQEASPDSSQEVQKSENTLLGAAADALIAIGGGG